MYGTHFCRDEVAFRPTHSVQTDVDFQCDQNAVSLIASRLPAIAQVNIVYHRGRQNKDTFCTLCYDVLFHVSY